MIHRVVKNSNYTIVNNVYLRDKALSFGAIGLMTNILSCKDDTNFNVKFLSMLTSKSEKVVTKYLNELKRNGYVDVEKLNSKDGFYYNYYVYESKELNPKYSYKSPDTQNPTWESPPLGLVDTNKYLYKQDKIDKLHLDLNNITIYLVDKGLIKVDDITLFAYDDFIKELFNNEDYKKVVKSISYTTNHILKNKFRDESHQPILNLFSYFKSSVISNINRQYTNEELEDLYDI
ncbi:MAG: hypothetical protein E7164_01105 [Firmicutes bacterium]|nr:hypothetical protein [Bacillota bacterium]